MLRVKPIHWSRVQSVGCGSVESADMNQSYGVLVLIFPML